ncbi:MAG: universal stress protein [Candidatus Bathyarchaeota archaeon]
MINEILVPFDGSENSEKGLRYACWLASKVKGTITVLYVVQIPVDGESIGLPIKPLVDAGQMILNKAKDIMENEKCTNTKFVLREASGNAGHEIIKFSKEMNCSLIIMSAKGHSALKHLLLGSVSETVTKYAPCSILIVK